jgi:hypothetical protein
VVVRHHDDRRALLVGDAPEQLHHVAPAVAVERRGGLVGEQERRSVRQRPGDGDALLLSAGELLRVVVHAVREAEIAEQLARACIRRPPDLIVELERQEHVLPRGEEGDQVGLLEHEADAGAPHRREVGERSSVRDHQPFVEPDPAALRQVQEAQRRQQRGLAGAAGSEQGRDLAALDGDGHVAQRDQLGVPMPIHLSQRLGANDGLVHGQPASTRVGGMRSARTMPATLARTQITATSTARPPSSTGPTTTRRGNCSKATLPMATAMP